MIADRLRAAILQAAISGKLTDQRTEDGTATELLEQIAAERAQLVKDKKLRKQKPLPPIADGELPFPLPVNWQWVRFGALLKYAQRGKSPAYADNSPYLAISQKCVKWSGFDPKLARPYTPESFESLPEERILSADDILWNSTGTGTVGRCTVLPPSGHYNNMAADSHVTVLRTFSYVLPRFIETFISSPHIQQNMDELTSGTTKQQELNLSTILGIAVPLPPLVEQERIITKLDEVLPLIDHLAELERERKHLDREFAKAIERAILQAAVSGKLTKQLPEDGTAAELLKTIQTQCQQLEKEGKIKKQKPLSPVDKSDEPFDLPGNWEWTRLGELGELHTGKTPSSSIADAFGEGIPFLTPGDISYSGAVYYGNRSVSEIGESHSRPSPAGTVMQVCIGGSAGKTAILDRRCCFNQQINAVNLAHGVKPGFVYWHLRSPVTQSQIDELKTGTATPIINKGRWATFPIALPPLAEQERIAGNLEIVWPLVREIGELVS